MKNYTTSVAVVVSGWPSQAESGRLCLVLLSSVFSWALLIIWADFQVEATENLKKFYNELFDFQNIHFSIS